MAQHRRLELLRGKKADAADEPMVGGKDASPGGATRRRAGDSAVVAVGIIAISAISAGQALVILYLVGASPSTDAFFAAYSVYAPIATLGTALRTTLVPLLGGSDLRDDLAAAAPVLGRSLLLALTATGTLVLASPLIAAALTAGHASATATAQSVLLVLSVAAGMQVLAGSLAAGLNALDRYRLSVTFFVGSSVLALGLSVALAPLLGVVGASCGLAIGASANAGAHFVITQRMGLRISARARWILSTTQMRFSGILVAGLALTAARQIVVTVALASLSGTAGAATIYSYAYYLIALFLNAAVVPLSVVTVPGLVTQIKLGSREAGDRYMMAMTPYMLAVLFPALVAFVVFGRPVIDGVFGASLSPHSLAALHRTAVWLAIGAVPTSVFSLASGILVSAHRWRDAAVAAGGTVLIHVVAFSFARNGVPESVAAAHAAASAASTAGLLVVTQGRAAWRLVWSVACRCAPGLLLCGVFPALAAGLGRPNAPFPALAVSAFGVVIYALLAWRFWEPVRSLGARLRST